LSIGKVKSLWLIWEDDMQIIQNVQEDNFENTKGRSEAVNRRTDSVLTNRKHYTDTNDWLKLPRIIFHLKY